MSVSFHYFLFFFKVNSRVFTQNRVTTLVWLLQAWTIWQPWVQEMSTDQAWIGLDQDWS